MPVNLNKEKAPLGKVIYQWQVKEYNKPERNRRWYILMGLLAIVLIIYGFYSANYLFILIVVLFGIITFLHEMHEPSDVQVAITETGVVIENKYYSYGELESFWFIYNPPEVKNLYFSLNGVIKHRLQVPLLNNDPRPIRDYLALYLEEDASQEEEPFSDRFARLFRLG